MVGENPTWGAPRIHGKLLMLGFDISERTISRWMKRAPRDPEPAKRWPAFLRNHREAIAAMDFFTCASPEFCTPVISTAYGVAIHRQGAKALDHDKRHLAPGGSDPAAASI